MAAYLDHAASTPMRPEAIDTWVRVQRQHPANPSGAHRAARAARQVLEEAREALAEVLGADPHQVVFTSGGTESDNLAVIGAVRRSGGAAVCTAVEHHAVLHPVEALGGRIVGVDQRGIVDLDQLADALDESVGVVSVMLANNETGVIQPLDQVIEVVRARAPRALVHTDAVQAFAWLDVARSAAGADLVSVSAHKFGGPKGVGALVVRDGGVLEPLILGGGQERGLRSGTQDVAGAAAMATAARLASGERDATVARIGPLRDRLADGLLAAVEGAVESGVEGGDRRHKVAGSCHVCIEGIESESLLFLLERAGDGVYASAASSCASGAQDPSHVLAAMGVPRSLAQGSLRLSLGWSSTPGDVDAALEAVPAAVAQLRRLSTVA